MLTDKHTIETADITRILADTYTQLNVYRIHIYQ